MTAKLIYPAFRCGQPHVAEATVEVRLTPKQIVVGRQTDPQIIYMDGRTSGPRLGRAEFRYWRHNGSLIGGHPMMRSWQLADGERKRLNAEAGERTAGR